MWDFNLSQNELRFFISICKGLTDLGSLSQAHKLSKNRSSEIVASLQEKGLVTEIRRRPKIVSVSFFAHSQALKNLIEDQGHIDWPKFLSNSTIRILVQILREPLPAKRLMNGLSKKTAYNVLDRSSAIGAIRTEDNKYQISDRFVSLKIFLEEFGKFYHLSLIQEIDQNLWMIYNGPDLALVGARKQIFDKRLIPTGIGGAPEYFGDLLSSQYLYLVSQRTNFLSEEHIVFAVLGNPNEGRIIRVVKGVLADPPENFNVKLSLKRVRSFGLEAILGVDIGD